MERLRNWSRDELVLLVLFWICLSLSGLFYLLAGAERRLQTKLMQYQPSLNTPKDAASVAGQVLRPVRDDDLRIKLGRNAASEVRSRWLYGSIVPKMRHVYAEMVG
jgi:hypothetical protein